jgi:N-acetylneuraminic acid mutarotase
VAWAWTGTEVLLFGGRIGGMGATAEGYGYNPATDTWRTLATAGAPSARYDAFATWMNGALLVWGGRDASNSALDTGAAKYDPVANTWTSVATSGDLSARSAPLRRTGWTGWTGTRALLFGGLTSTPQIDGRSYQSSSNTWQAAPSFPSGDAHEWGVGVWTGAELVVWSGLDGGVLDGSGERYKP